MDPIWARYAYLLDETGKYTVKLKPEVVKACKKKVLQPWALSEAEALLQQLFGAKRLPDEFRTIFGNVNDYLSDDLNRQESVYEISDPIKMGQWTTDKEKELMKEHHNDIWRFSLRSDPNGQIVGFYCPLICCRDLMGYIFLFNGWNLQGENFNSYDELAYIDFLARKGFIEI